MYSGMDVDDVHNGETITTKIGNNPSLTFAPLHVRGFRDVTMLNYWGAVVIEKNTTGFAMEFIGDMHDSAATSAMDNSVPVSGVN